MEGTSNLNPAFDDGTFWYFAIGSMMNPASMSNRGFTAYESKPAELLDFDLKFFSSFGVAEAVPSPGKSIHGVLHRVDEKTMAALDKIEAAYVRVLGTARSYDGSEMPAYVYSSDKDMELLKDKRCHLPNERYLDVIIEGAKHFGVKESYIDFLKNIDCVPRPLPHEFKAFEVCMEDLPLMTFEKDVKPYDGTKTPVIRTTINGKVKESTYPSMDDPMFKIFSHFILEHGQVEELLHSKLSYEPKYGTPEKIEDFTREHCAYIENEVYNVGVRFGTINRSKIIGRIEQKYRDEEDTAIIARAQ